MVAWGHGLGPEERRQLHRVAAWPLATVTAKGELAGIVMQDVRDRFELPFLMPSGRVANVMLQLEHLLGPDDFLRRAASQIPLDTLTRAAGGRADLRRRLRSCTGTRSSSATCRRATC